MKKHVMFALLATSSMGLADAPYIEDERTEIDQHFVEDKAPLETMEDHLIEDEEHLLGKRCVITIYNKTKYKFLYTTDWVGIWDGKAPQYWISYPGDCNPITRRCLSKSRLKVWFNEVPGDNSTEVERTIRSGRSRHETCEDGRPYAFKKIRGKKRIILKAL